jgi:hypothetical protein
MDKTDKCEDFKIKDAKSIHLAHTTIQPADLGSSKNNKNRKINNQSQNKKSNHLH